MTAPSPAPISAPEASSGTGLVYADVPNRVIAYIIDAIILAIIGAVLGAILGAIGLSPISVNGLAISYNYVASIILAIIGLVIGGAYFVYMWTTSRATIGMKLLSLQIGNSGDGATLTMEQAIKRFLVLSGPGVLAQVFAPLPLIGLLISLLALGWVIFLLVTTAQSPTKQGFHDKFANTQVVKAAKSVT